MIQNNGTKPLNFDELPLYQIPREHQSIFTPPFNVDTGIVIVATHSLSLDEQDRLYSNIMNEQDYKSHIKQKLAFKLAEHILESCQCDFTYNDNSSTLMRTYKAKIRVMKP